MRPALTLHPAARIPLLLWLLALATAALPARVLAVEQLHLDMGSLAGDGWQVQDLEVDLQLDGAAEIRARRLQLPAPVGELHELRLQCRHLDLGGNRLQCRTGTLRAGDSLLGRGPMPVSFRYTPSSGALHVALRNGAVAGGQLDLELSLRDGDWRAQVNARQVDAARLSGVAGISLPAGLQVQAALDVDADVRGRAAQLQHVGARIRSAKAGYASADGVNAAENLALQLELSATPKGEDWQLQGTLAAARGTVCSTSCWDLPVQPVSLQFKAQWLAGASTLAVSQFTFADTGTLQANGSLRYRFDAAPSPWQSFDVGLQSDHAERLYSRYLQPLLIGTALESLRVQGGLRAQLRQTGGAGLSIRFEPRQLSFQDAKQRFGLRGLDGHLAWQNDSTVQRSDLSWQGGNLYQIPIGASRLQFETGANSLRLTAPASVPVFDGSMEIAQFAMADPGQDDMRWNLDAVLTPVAMQDFSRAMGWPEMAGRLSGVIPELQYAQRRLSVNGVLLIRAFDGDITIRNLNVNNLLGVVPTLNADVQLRNIDLQKLTGTFSFGRIEGRLEGAMDGLELQNWRPVAFDARFVTPGNDDSRHRISQRAVDNLTSLGGGVGGALSRSFLRFFDDFSYDRLGLRCRLHNGVCEMGGVAPAPNGYYIVKGGGLPRIDVIGYQRRVNWPVLIKRLEAVTSGSGPVIR